MLAGIAAMAKEGAPFLFGDKITIADIAVLSLFEAGEQFGFDAASAAPSLKRIATAVTADASLSAYFAARPGVEAKDAEARTKAEEEAKAEAATAGAAAGAGAGAGATTA